MTRIKLSSSSSSSSFNFVFVLNFRSNIHLSAPRRVWWIDIIQILLLDGSTLKNAVLFSELYNYEDFRPYFFNWAETNNVNPDTIAKIKNMLDRIDTAPSPEFKQRFYDEYIQEFGNSSFKEFDSFNVQIPDHLLSKMSRSIDVYQVNPPQLPSVSDIQPTPSSSIETRVSAFKPYVRK